MKQLVTLFVAVALFSTGVWAQCTPNQATGNPGLSPPTDSLPCVNVGVPYNEVVYLENFDQFTFSGLTASVDSLRIDSITNVPCGLSYAMNKPSRTYAGGETGCISITGTSYENIGQYRLNIYVTVWATAPFVGQQTFSGEASAVIAQIEQISGPLGIDFNYFLRVKDQQTTTCPPIDRNNSSANLTASASCAPPVFTATVTGSTEVCAGDSATITVTFTNGVPPYNILWSNGGTSATLTLAAGSYTLTAVDSNTDTATANVTVTELPLPTADFGATATAGSGAVTLTNSSSNATTYSWDFAGLATETGATPTYSFTEDGTYDITLIATNACGSDTTVETVTISGIVGINELGSIFSSVQISPNPSNGNFTLQLVANENSPVSVKVFNLQGQAIYTSILNTVAGQASTQSIKLDNAANGIYIIQVQASDALVTQKLIVK